MFIFFDSYDCTGKTSIATNFANRFALRFPKFTGRIRDDKNIRDSTLSSEILQIYNSQSKLSN